MCSAQLAVPEQSTRDILLKSLFAVQNKTLCAFPHMPVKTSTIERAAIVRLAPYLISATSQIVIFLTFSL